MEESDIDENDILERSNKLGFLPQKEIIYNKLLPYCDELDEESLKLLLEIKENFAKAVLGREVRPAVGIWSSRLMRYIKVYGLKFSKEDHLAFIELSFQLCLIPNLEPTKITKFATLLSMLLKKKDLLSRSDLELPWRPLYDLCTSTLFKGTAELGMYRHFSRKRSPQQKNQFSEMLRAFIGFNLFDLPTKDEIPNLEQSLQLLVNVCKHYFPLSATREILDELTPRMCPFDSVTMEDAMQLLVWFLPFTLPAEHKKYGHELWLNDFMVLWDTCNNAPKFEHEMMNMVAAISPQNMGYIDWEPYIPMMFTRFLRSLNLPVSFKHRTSSKGHSLDANSIAVWIVSVLGPKTSAQKYLSNFMAAVESYLHPANTGSWVHKLRSLVSKLPLYFVQRVSRERYRKLTWENPTPEEYKLTDDDITQFVECLKPIAMQTMFSPIGTNDQTIIMQSLAFLRPSSVIPMLIDKMYSTLDSLTEPHKLTACMISLVAVARPLTQGFKNGYPEGPTHIIPLLFATLPGIDPNDFKKSLVTSHFISIFAMLIPIVDCSKASEYYELTEEEHIVCEATAGFEDFVLQYLDRVFLLIDSSSFEMTRMEQRESDNARSKLDSLSESAIASTTNVLLMQCSPEIFKSALRKMYSFVTTRVLETKVSGQFTGSMCRSFSRVNSAETLKLFVPYLCNAIRTSLAEHENVQTEEKLDNECLYHLLLLSEIIEGNGYVLLKYVDEILSIIDKTLHLVCKEACNLSSKTLRRIFTTFSAINPLEYKSTLNINKPIEEFLHIREWGGTPKHVNDAQITWHEPNNEELDKIEEMVYKYLLPEVHIINQYSSGTMELSRDELQQHLQIIVFIINGCGSLFPMWEEEAINLVESALPRTPFLGSIGTKRVINMPDGSNIRQEIIKMNDNLQRKLLTTVEDDTKSLLLVINIWDIIITRKTRSRDFETLQKNFQVMKRVLKDRLTGKKNHIRSMLIDRAYLQHEFRLDAQSYAFTATTSLIFKNMLELSTSYYSIVRIRAQSRLSCMFNLMAYSYLSLLPQILEYLKLDANEHHERFKGILYVLLGPRQRPLICKYDWAVVSQVWPALLNSLPSEKLSVIRLLELAIDTVHKHFPTITITLNIQPELIQSAEKLLQLSGNPNSFTEKDSETGIAMLQKFNADNLKMYNSLLSDLLKSVQSGNLHWRYQNMGMSYLRDLVHLDCKYPAHCVKYFVNSLINDSLDLRKLAIRAMVYVFKQQKRTHKKILIDPYKIAGVEKPDKIIPGERPDNLWLKYNSKTVPRNQKEWDEPRYIHKPHVGYYTWPQKVEVYAPSCDQPKLLRSEDELNDVEKEIHSFFSNAQNVDKLIGFLSLEDKKGADKFNAHKYILFKGLFRNHGNTYLPQFLPHLRKLVADKNESKQRCAAEILAGIIRGSKHWSFDMVNNMWTELIPIIKIILNNITVETINDWGICLATCTEHRDPNRHYWLYEVIMEDPLRTEASSSFLDCGRLYSLQGAVNQQGWRATELFERMLIYFKPFLNHPFQNVRERIASFITNIFEQDLTFPNGNLTTSALISKFVVEIMPQLEILKDSSYIKNDIITDNELASKILSNHADIGANINAISTQIFAAPDILNMAEIRPTEMNLRAGVKNFLHNNSDLVEGIDTSELDSVVRNDIPFPSSSANSSGTGERENSIRLFKTVLKYVVGSLSRALYSCRPEFFQLLSLACRMENSEQDAELSKYCTEYIALMAQSFMLPDVVPVALESVQNIATNGLWWAKCNVLDFLQVLVFHNMAVLLSNKVWVRKIQDIVLELLEDIRLEVREKAGQVLGGLLHCDFILSTEELLDQFILKSKTKLKRHRRVQPNATQTKGTWEGIAVRTRHTAVLGMCAFISAYPYDVPNFMPEVFQQLGAHLNDPQPIPSTIRKTLGDFKRTHHDNWETHQLKFTEDQLAVLSELSVPPSYYA